MKKKIGIALAFIILVAGVVFGVPYVERHYVTAKSDIILENNEGEETNTLIVYFTRYENIDDQNIDATSIASVMIDGNGNKVGNGKTIAYTIQSFTHGKVVSILTDDKYSSSYAKNASEAKNDFDNNTTPIIHVDIEDMSQYDTIYLVYPLWWSTLPQPVKQFLVENDLQDKTLIPVCNQGSSGFGNTIEVIKEHTNATVSDKGISIYCSDVKDCEKEIKDWLVTKKLIQLK